MDDKSFLKIEQLNWLPWIGKEYINIPANKKILFVGESHYQKETLKSKTQHSRIDFTRIVIEEQGVNGNHYTKIFPNLYKALFNDLDIDSKEFWNNVCYYNFIQRPMEGVKSRPKTSDFLTGWEVFESLINLIKPAIVIFIGTSSANYLSRYKKNNTSLIKPFDWNDKINGAYAKSTEFDNTKILAIKHTSSRFSSEKWNEYLNKKIRNELKWHYEKITAHNNG